MKNRKVPKTLQGILWSVDVSKLDLERDKSYIVNQILAYGVMDEWRWLFKNYSLGEIVDTFLNRPSKIYLPQRFLFSKNILLGLRDKNLIKERYVVNTPRIIERRPA